MPMFASYDRSPACHWTCEWADLGSVCDCKSCGCLNHGRTAYYHRRERMNGVHRQFLDKRDGHWIAIDIWQNGPLRWFTERVA